MRRRFRTRAVAAQVPVTWGQFRIVTPRFIDAAHRSGLEVHVWTINDSAQMGHLLDLGVDGIMSDRPDELKELLMQRGAWN